MTVIWAWLVGLITEILKNFRVWPKLRHFLTYLRGVCSYSRALKTGFKTSLLGGQVDYKCSLTAGYVIALLLLLYPHWGCTRLYYYNYYYNNYYYYRY